MNPDSSHRTSFKLNFHIVARYFVVFLVLYTALITAWISDDAQITFRQVWNFISGDGITFNFNERVQAFTHPLWFFVLSGITAITRESFLTTTFLGVLTTLISVIFMLRLENNLREEKYYIVSPVIFLVFSWAFCDYMTSGLENSLSYLLISILIYLLFASKNKYKSIYVFTVLSLLVLNRFDFLILFGPLAIYLLYEEKNFKQSIRSILPGSILLISWITFAVFYFGSPFPNTYYAKLYADYPESEILERGLSYFISLKYDLVTAIIIFVSIITSILSKNFKLISLTIGKIAYMYYIYSIGGDFMRGRFLSVLVILSIGELIVGLYYFKSISFKIKNASLLVIFLAILIVGAESKVPFFSWTDYTWRKSDGAVVDERGFYYLNTGLFAEKRNGWPKISIQPKSMPEVYRFTCGLIGGKALNDASVYLIDLCALSDPYISRLPAIHHEHWRIGHHFRRIPTNYGDFKIGKIDKIPENRLSDLFNDLQLATNAGLLAPGRFSAIWRLNTNKYNDLNIDEYKDPSFWLPFTQSEEHVLLDDWESDILLDDLPLAAGPKYHRFNTTITVESKKSAKTNFLWLFIDHAYSYEVSVNNNLLLTLPSERGYCKNGFKLVFLQPRDVKSVKFRAIDDDETTHYGFNWINYLRIGKDDSVEFEERCTFFEKNI